MLQVCRVPAHETHPYVRDGTRGRLALIQTLEWSLGAAAAIAFSLYLGLSVMGRVRRSKRFRIGAAMTAALFSFVTYRDPAERAPVEESEAETRRKKEKGAGDPTDGD